MKKLILILSILALNAFAVNCRDYMRLSVPSWDFEEYYLDSVYKANYFGSFVYYTVLKYHYTNSNLDSIVRCVDVDDCEYTHTKIMTEKTNTSTNRTIYTNDIFFGEEITSIDGDSSTYISYDMSKDTISDEEIASLDSSVFAYIRIIQNRVFIIDDMTMTFLKNDTLKKIEAAKNISITTPDANNENICNVTVYEYPKNDSTFQNLENIIDEYQDTITNTENGFIVSFSNNDAKWFYVLANEPTTSIRRKVRPATIPEKARHFDLLGRPVKGRYTVEFLK